MLQKHVNLQFAKLHVNVLSLLLRGGGVDNA